VSVGSELKVLKKASSMKGNNKGSGVPINDAITEVFRFFIKRARTTTVKRRVAYVLFSMVSWEILFLSMHPHHEIGLLEIGEAGFVCLLGVILHFTDAHRHFISLSNYLHEHVELGGFDRFQYIVADVITQISSRVRKIQTGMLSHNMLMFLLGISLLMFLLFLGQ
jgi:hypothetical protein